MAWQLRDLGFREAIHDLLDRTQCVLAGTVGVQVHLAAAIGLDKLGPPAHAIEVIPIGATVLPSSVSSIPVARVDAMGFDGSVEAAARVVALGAERFRVAAPEHILGLALAASELPPDAKWACFLLMRTLEGQLDLEEARGFIKRCGLEDRQSLLAELAYLAA
ncbi:MAG: hypothetical protein HY791_24525 [Deltaproteobacteria bacterium]|nr:hypothetical protein [Deltaproteobacteria bacterium]